MQLRTVAFRLRTEGRAGWIRFWMRQAGLSRWGRLATRLAAAVAPPYKAREYLAGLNPRGYVDAGATIYHDDLRLGAHVFVGPDVTIFQATHGGFVELGDHSRVYGDVLLETGQEGSIALGAHSRIHRGSHLIAYKAPIIIGRDVGIAQNCAFYSYDHGFHPGSPISSQPLQSKGPIVIGDHSWLGTGVIVLSGVRIGTGAVVASGSVVTTDVPEGAIAVGVPARVVKLRKDL
jgi:acetyltransferase-like isoleucine patch superfamily enzyme